MQAWRHFRLCMGVSCSSKPDSPQEVEPAQPSIAPAPPVAAVEKPKPEPPSTPTMPGQLPPGLTKHEGNPNNNIMLVRPAPCHDASRPAVARPARTQSARRGLDVTALARR